MRPARLLAALALAGLTLVPAGTARAADDLAPADAAIVALQAEIMVLVELDALAPPLPPKVREVHDRWASSAAGMDRADLLDWLVESDRDGAAVLSALADPSAQVRAALGPLSEADLATVRRGGRVSVAAAVYAKAWFDLDERDGRDPSADPAVPAPVTTTATSAEGSPASSTATSTILAVVVGSVAFVVAVFSVLFRRRPTGERRDELSGRAAADLLDAGQRLAGSLDHDEVERRAVEEAVALTRADHGAFVRSRASARAVTHTTTPGFPADADLARGVVARALDAGQTARTSGSDRTVSGARLALLAVPTVHAGAVVGALVVARPAARPFTPADAESLGRLAPLVAGALDAAARHADAAELALVDPLTAVGNRRRLQRDLPGALDAGPVGLAMVDVDHFKRFNDTFGHQDGDEALRLVAAALRANVRDTDVVYRYGGEEFCVLLPGATPEEARETGERLRLAVAAATALSWSTDARRALTVSVGVALSTGDGGDDLVARADHALYAAKRAGRDRVVMAD